MFDSGPSSSLSSSVVAAAAVRCRSGRRGATDGFATLLSRPRPFSKMADTPCARGETAERVRRGDARGTKRPPPRDRITTTAVRGTCIDGVGVGVEKNYGRAKKKRKPTRRYTLDSVSFARCYFFIYFFFPSPRSPLVSSAL